MQLQSRIWPGHVSRSRRSAVARSLPARAGEVRREQQLDWFHVAIPEAIARDIKTPWLLSTGEDLRFPGAEGKRSLSIRLLNRYMQRVIELTASDPHMTATLLRVRNLLKPLSTLFRPHFILAV